jgi:UDP-glucose 4-epimerase
MPRILITGASGFIGGHLVAEALSLGYEVTAAIRAGSDRSRLSDPRLQLLELSLENEAEMVRTLAKNGRFNWVIHNAGVTKALSREAYLEGNVANTQRLVQALQQSGTVPDKFLFVSSLAALGAAPRGSTAIQAGQAPNPLTFYGESKYEAECFLSSLHNNFPWVVVQPTAVFGPWERDILTFIRLTHKGLEMSIGRHSQRLSFIHAQDVAGAIFHILEKPKTVHRKFILSDGKAYQTEDLGAAVRQALGKKSTLKIRLPLALVRQVAAVSETIGKWQNKAVPLNRDKIAELAADNWHCDAGALLNELQYKPRYDLYGGMIDAVQWYRHKGWL